MNKQKLVEKYGLTDEQASEIVDSLDGAYVAKDRFNQVNESLKSTKADLTLAQKQMGVLEAEKTSLNELLMAKADDPNAVTALQSQLLAKDEEITALKADHEEELAALKLDHAIIAQLTDAQDPAIVLGLIKKEGLALTEDGKVSGLEDQLKALKEEKAFLFKAPDEPAKPSVTGFRPFEVGGAGNAPKVGKDAYMERLAAAQTSMERIQIKNEAFADGVVLE